MDNKKQQQDEEVLDKDDLVDTESQDSSTDNDAAQSEETVEGENVTDINSKLDEKKLQDELDELDDKYQRLQAEYANYRRRTQQEKDSLALFANEKIMTELIPVVDSMERALEACEDKEDSMYKGIDLVHKQLIDTLSKLGLEHIEALEQEFDPNYHLAVMQESVEGVEPNKVVMELQKGYKLGNKVIRASMVKVSC
ncbi:nucleotide exchange factor GrpE [Metaclostridioides mangenotii]|uniref:Protein GrpE n=1 Tax=Metaclostridioides mangenotii TaxID=1540 RepID=A0ABS4E6T5_9FIRM|nr:nucleotide exchange factor GrpE [Clostridioides mangenotii]MBP1853644.1 molecular chaperone GrpE [Clostridioides mangenotii]